MKTINPKNALKLFLFLFILFSAKTFSNPKLPMNTSSECESKFGCAKKATATPKKPAATYAAVTKGNTVQSKNRFKK